MVECENHGFEEEFDYSGKSRLDSLKSEPKRFGSKRKRKGGKTINLCLYLFSGCVEFISCVLRYLVI